MVAIMESVAEQFTNVIASYSIRQFFHAKVMEYILKSYFSFYNKEGKELMKKIEKQKNPFLYFVPFKSEGVSNLVQSSKILTKSLSINFLLLTLILKYEKQ